MSTLPPEGEARSTEQSGTAPTPPASGSGQPQPSDRDPMSTLTLNYWLSVFFTWISALIFYFLEKDRSTPQVRALHVANLNFSLLRTAVFVVASVLGLVPVVGTILTAVLGLVSLALFVLHILATLKLAEAAKSGGRDPFMFNYPLVK